MDEIGAQLRHLPRTPRALRPRGRQDRPRVPGPSQPSGIRHPLVSTSVVTAVTPRRHRRGQDDHVGGAGAGSPAATRAVVALRQPSMGPTFGIKGGAAGGGYSQVVPMERLNAPHGRLPRHHCSTTCSPRWSTTTAPRATTCSIDVRNITRRVLDVNDRSLRNVDHRPRGREDGVPRETGFDITAASEIMVLLTLAKSLSDLRQRLGRIVIGTRPRARACGRGPRRRGRDGRTMSRTRSSRTCCRPSKVARHHCGPFGNTATGVVGHRRLIASRAATTRSARPGSAPGHGRRAVLQRQVPRERAQARPRGHRRHGAALKSHSGNYVGRASRCLSGLVDETRPTSRPGCPTSASASRSCAGSVCSRSSRSTPSRRTTTPSTT